MMKTRKARLALLSTAVAGLMSAVGSVSAQETFECPKVGGDLIVAVESGIPTLDQHTTSAGATRNIAMNIYESLITRDADMSPVLDLATDMDVSDDGLRYTFHLREGVTFHNGKPMTSADVAASFARYKEIGGNRSNLDIVETWETPDDNTFVLVLKQPQATFIENLSTYTVPIVIMPAEEAAKGVGEVDIIGTGPFKLVEFVPDSHVLLERFDDYVASDVQPGLSGFGGHKQACVDTVRFRMITETGARMAALETGEVHIATSVPATSKPRLEALDDVTLVSRLQGVSMGYPNFSRSPTDNLLVRQAMAAAINAEDIIFAASDGEYELEGALQYPSQAYYSTAGLEYYNQNDPDKASALLEEAGYDGEPVILLATQQFQWSYNAALVMNEQLKVAGFNSEVSVLDWPTALATSQNADGAWNFFFTVWTSTVQQGGPIALRNFADPNNVFTPPNNEGPAEFNAIFDRVENGATLEERIAAFGEGQEYAFENVLGITFGILRATEGLRPNVRGYKSFTNVQVSNIWLDD